MNKHDPIAFVIHFFGGAILGGGMGFILAWFEVWAKWVPGWLLIVGGASFIGFAAGHDQEEFWKSLWLPRWWRDW
ncbi:MAG: hypothetical protein V1809_04355 [Planctomycetota bacterium]